MKSTSLPTSVRVAALIAVGALTGCAAFKNSASNTLPTSPELQTLADLQPPVRLPAPTTVPTEESSIDGLEHYARGRDALLRNQKAIAIQELTAAVEADPLAAVAWRDLGYARLGMDDSRAMIAFRTARNLDPKDADSRLQLARLLLTAKKTDDAVAELRLARISPDYDVDDGLGAVVDLLLGQSLEQAHYRTAALECYEHVLSVVDDRSYSLRGRPELAEVVGRPSILILRIADLAVQCGKFPRAIALYQRLQRQEPQSAQTFEVRLARAEMAAGDQPAATKRALGVVTNSQASTLSLTLFEDLFEPYGGPAAALKSLDGVDVASTDRDTLELLRANLLLAVHNPAGAQISLDKVKAISLPLVRMTVQAYRAIGADPGDPNYLADQVAGRNPALYRTLIARLARSPESWHTLERGWAMLTHIGQPHPLTPEALLKLNVPPASIQARDFVTFQLFAARGRQKSASQVGNGMANANDFVRAIAAAPPLDLNDLNEVTTSTELAVLIDAYRDDPELLSTTVAEALKAGQKRMALDAFEAVHAARPTDPVIASLYSQVLLADDQRGEAVAVLDKAVAAASSASELYFLSSQYAGMGDEKGSERVLRKGYEHDPNNAAVCNDLGYLLTDQGRELPFAETLLSKAAELEPDNAAYLDSFGWLLYKRGKFADAAGRLADAVSLSTPVDAVVLDHAGDAFYQDKKPEKAAEFWQKAVDAIKQQRSTSDPQLRLRIEQKLKQLKEKTPVVVAPVAKAE